MCSKFNFSSNLEVSGDIYMRLNITSKHLMTGHKGNSEFCFPETLNIEVKGKQNSLFPEGPVIKCFVTPPDSKIEKAPKKIICLRPLPTLAAVAKLSGCKNQPVLSKSHDNSLFLRS